MSSQGESRLLRLPGFVNAHSHAFHRALRGLSELRSGDFWTWRQLMYSVADRLDPDSYRELATYVYAEMVLAGWTAVGEFHYLHHGPGGTPYSDRNEMTWSILEAARVAGIRLTVLDACYLQAGVKGEELSGAQLRFSDGDGDSWSRRVTEAAESGRLAAGEGRARLGAAIHSVRAVPPSAMGSVAAWAAHNDAPLHVHVSEQRRENDEALAELSMTPTEVLVAAGAVTSAATAVHATHLTASDVTRWGFARASVCACPTTERDLGDGVGPFPDLVDSGARLCLGSDSHAVVDPFEEARSLETHCRLVAERRGVFGVDALLHAASAGGARSLGWDPAAIEGRDYVELRLDGSLPLAGGDTSEDESRALAVFAAGPGDVERVVVGGETLVEGGEHVRLGPRRAVAAGLRRAILRVIE
ncbi:MAG TPA: formimidoylglutamate deiminase [Acidimicrobiales bacterium]|nr:formimidoylglutamate deiminase [Acidimicrobiales bacterium]